MKESRRSKAERSLVRSAERLYESLKKGPSTSIRTKGMFFIMKQAVFKFADNPADRTYWTEQGWAQGEKPWNQTKGKQE